MNNNELFNLGFLKNIPMGKVEFEDENGEFIDANEESKKKLNNIINLIKENKEKFENWIIASCSSAINYDYCVGDAEEEDDFFEQCFKPYLLQEMTREEYQKNVELIEKRTYEEAKKSDNFFLEKSMKYAQEMRKIFDYDKFFANNLVQGIVVGNEFSIEISDYDLIIDPIVIEFNYDLEVENVYT